MIRSKAFLAMAMAVTAAFPALSQAQAQQNPIDPQITTYQAFFFRVVWLQGLAGGLAAQGKRNVSISTVVQRGAGLTAQEAASLGAVAADWRTTDLALLGQIRTLSAAAPGRGSPQLTSLVGQRLQNVANHLDQLQSTLGTTRFAVLDYYVHSTVAVNSVTASNPPQ